MKRKIALFLTIILTLSMCLCSCGSESGSKSALATPKPTEDAYNTAMYYISQGNYELGYSGLLAIKDYDKASEALKHFVFLPGKVATRVKGETNPDNYHITEYSYGANGLIIGRSFTESTIVIANETFTYEGDLLKTSVFKGDGLREYTASYTFDADMKLIEVFYTDTDENFARTTYKYDGNGYVSKAEHTDYDGNVTVNNYVFDSKGQILSKHSYEIVDGEEKLISKCEYIYNDKGVLIGGVLTKGEKVTEIGYSEHRLFYNPKHSDLIMYY